MFASLFVFYLVILLVSATTDLDGLLLLTAGLTPKRSSWTSSTPACSWSGITCSGRARSVTSIAFQGAFSGTVNLSALPQFLKSIYLNNNQLTGSVDLSQLPMTLVYAELSRSQLTGSLNLTQVPSTLKYLYLHGNAFSGGIDLQNLPKSLKTLTLDGWCGASSKIAEGMCSALTLSAGSVCKTSCSSSSIDCPECPSASDEA